MYTRILAVAIFFSLGGISCAQSKKSANPAADGFDMAGSDPKAVEIADQVMQAMGGRKAWDNTHYISWNFFGAANSFGTNGRAMCGSITCATTRPFF